MIPDPAVAAQAVPGLVGRQEIAFLLGITPPRVNALVQTPGWKKYVHPVQTLKTGTLYLESQVMDFADNWERRVGRPANEEGLS